MTYTMQSWFHLRENNQEVVLSWLFHGTSHQRIMDDWGRKLNHLRVIDSTVSSICEPIQEHGN